MRFNDNQLASFDILSRRFVDEFRRRFVLEDISETITSRPEIHIPAASKAVGNLVVYLDGDEVTVEVGELYHRHFSFWEYGSALNDESINPVVDEALEFIRQVMADKIVFRLFFRDGRIAGATAGQNPTNAIVDGPSGLSGLLFRDFRWSGPLEDRQ